MYLGVLLINKCQKTEDTFPGNKEMYSKSSNRWIDDKRKAKEVLGRGGHIRFGERRGESLEKKGIKSCGRK